MEWQPIAGWVFSSADFSMNARNPNCDGWVRLIRIYDDYLKWARVISHIDNEDEWPECGVIGIGKTLIEALNDANRRASLLPPLPPTNSTGG